jgi:hypothetical protein
MEVARVRLAEELDADDARLTEELGADGDRLDEELDPAPIALDPVPPPAPLSAAAGIRTTASAPAACGLALLYSDWNSNSSLDPRSPEARARFAGFPGF